MRTTIAIDDQLLDAAKDRARRLGVTLGNVVNSALRRELAVEEDSERRPVPVFRGGSGPRAGVDLRSNRSLSEVMDEDVDLNKRR
ncbi:ribbon-helix-helix protein, CopG family [soil metagenome]